MVKRALLHYEPELIRGTIAVDRFARQSLAQYGRRAVGRAASPVTSKRAQAERTILIRGFDLRAVDSVLRLCEGRGGLFTSDSPVPRYDPSGREPVRIDIRNRSGRPMLARPTDLTLVSNSFWYPYRQQLSSIKPENGKSFQENAWPLVVQVAADLLAEAGHSLGPRDVEDWWRSWSRYTMDTVTARRVLLQSLGVATGRRKIDIPFALGETWRKLSPNLKEFIDIGGVAVDRPNTYTFVEREMERIAFGPSTIVTAKLISLLRARYLTIGAIVF